MLLEFGSRTSQAVVSLWLSLMMVNYVCLLLQYLYILLCEMALVGMNNCSIV